MLANGHEHMVGPVEYLGIVEAQNGKTLRPQETIAPLVVVSTGVRFVAVAVNFDDDACRKPCEIGDIGSDWCFSPKTGAEGTQVAQHVPHRRFGFGHFRA